MSNIHNILDDDDLHVSKGFVNALVNAHLLRNEKNEHAWEQRVVLPQALKLVLSVEPPPSEVYGYTYLLDGTTSIHANWDDASGNDWVRYDGTTWNAISPEEGFLCYEKYNGEYLMFDGTSWESFGGGGGGATEPLVMSAAAFSSLNPVLELGQFGIETNGLTTIPKYKIGDGSTAYVSLPYASNTTTIANSLFVMPGGNNTTATIGRIDRPYLTITAAQTAASSGDTIFIFGGQTYTDSGLGKSGVTYHYLGSPTHTTNAVIYETSAGITFTVLGDAVFNSGSAATVRALTSSSNNITFKCKSATRTSGGASCVVCTEGVINFEASEYVSSDTNCATATNGTLTIKSPKYIGGGSTLAILGSGTIYSHGEIFVTSTAAELRSALINVSTGKLFHTGNITYSNPNAIAGIVHIQIGTGGYIRLNGNIYATSFNASFGVVYLIGTESVFDLFGKIIGTKTIRATGTGAQFNEVFIPEQDGHYGETLHTDGTSTYWSADSTGTGSALAVDIPKSGDTVRFASKKRGQNFIASGLTTYVTSGGYNGLLIAVPYVIGKTHYVTGIEFEVVTAVALGKARLNLYADNGSGEPGTLIEYAGEVDCSTTGLKTVNFSVNRLLLASDQIVWMAIEVNSATIQLRYVNNPINVLPWNSAATTTTSNIYTVSQSYGSSPSPFTAGSFKTTGGWGIDVRLVSLNAS